MDDKMVGDGVRDVCYLAACAVRGEVPDGARVAVMDLDEVYRVSQRHLLASACATALELAGVVDERFRQAQGKAIRKIAVMDIERARIFSLMDASGIWYAPLKGVVLQGIYPVFGMRQLSDNDVLYHTDEVGRRLAYDHVSRVLRVEFMGMPTWYLTAHGYIKLPAAAICEVLAC